MIPITTQEQLIELAARSTWLLSMLRAYTKDHEDSLAIATLCKNDEVKLWESRIDAFLQNIDAVKFQSLKELINDLTVNISNGKQIKS